MISDLQPELLVNEHCACGENPLWDEERGQLLWTDIPGKKIFAWDAATGQHRTVWQGKNECGAFCFQEDGSILLLLTGRAEILDLESGKTRSLLETIPSAPGRFNDCIAAPDGRVISGTMAPNKAGSLFRLDHDGSLSTIATGTGCSNGLGFSPDLTQLYWADSTAQTIYLFDYDASTGAISQQRVWKHTPGHTPDGLTVDAEGDVWACYFVPGALRRYSPSGELKQEIAIPARHVTSCIFGGKNGDELFVTTAGGGKADAGELDGATFRLRPGVRGQQRFRSRISAPRSQSRGFPVPGFLRARANFGR